MIRFLKYSLFVLFINQVYGQSIIKGKVFYQNSGFIPAEKVKIKANYANETPTSSQGDFILDFIDNHVDERANITIGINNIGTDIDGNEVELVNKNDLKYISIPKGVQDSIHIIVCPKGSLDRAARKYYKIIKNDSEKELKYLKNQLLINQRNQHISKDSILALKRLIKGYEKLNDSITIYKEAFRIVSINRDGASPRTIKFLNKLRAGQSVKEARKELSTKNAFKEANQGGKIIKSRIEEIRTNANSLATEYKFKEVISQLDTINMIIKINSLEKIRLVENYEYINKLYETMGDIDNAIDVLEKAKKILDEYKYFNLKKVEINIILGEYYTKKGDYEKAKESFEIVQSYFNKIKDKKETFTEIELHLRLILGLGDLYSKNKDTDGAAGYFNEFIDLVESSEMLEDSISSFKDILVNKALALSAINNNNHSEAAKHYLNIIDLYAEVDEFVSNEFNMYEVQVLIELGKSYFHPNNLDSLSTSYWFFNKAIDKLNIIYKMDPVFSGLELVAAYVYFSAINFYYYHETYEPDYKKRALDNIEKGYSTLSTYPFKNDRYKEVSNGLTNIDMKVMSASKKEGGYIKMKRKILILKQQIDSSKVFASKVLLQTEVIEKLTSYYHDYPKFKKIKSELSNAYGTLAWYALFDKEFNLALESAIKGLDLDPSNKWINTNLSLACLFNDDYEKAEKIYTEFKDIPYGDSSFREVFKQDIKELEEAGIIHSDFIKIKALLED